MGGPEIGGGAAAAPPRFAGAVLTGGRSSRLGRDKAVLVPGDGGPMLAARACTALRAAGAVQCMTVGGPRRDLALDGCRHFPDDGGGGEGPLAGLVTALHHATADPVVVLSCDLPLITPEAVSRLVDALALEPGADAAIPVDDGRLQVLVAAYRRRAGSRLAAALAGGERSVSRAVASLVVFPVEGFDHDWLTDLDVPADVDHYALGHRGNRWGSGAAARRPAGRRPATPHSPHPSADGAVEPTTIVPTDDHDREP